MASGLVEDVVDDGDGVGDGAADASCSFFLNPGVNGSYDVVEDVAGQLLAADGDVVILGFFFLCLYAAQHGEQGHGQ